MAATVFDEIPATDLCYTHCHR